MRERESECHYRVTVMSKGGVIWEMSEGDESDGGDIE